MGSDRVQILGWPRKGDRVEVLSDGLCEGAPCTGKCTSSGFFGFNFLRHDGGETAFIRHSEIVVDWSGHRNGTPMFGVRQKPRSA